MMNKRALNNLAALLLLVLRVPLIDSLQASSQQQQHQVIFEGPVSDQRHQHAGEPLLAGEQARFGPKRNGRAATDEQLNLVEADENGLYLVGLFDIHHSNARAPFKCGPIDIGAGEWQSRRPMQNLEAFLWAIEQVNADKQLLPGIKLGSLVLDTCSSFLRTNQQLANLLHQHPHQQTAASVGPLPGVRQLMAIVADNQDWPSVEAVASMSSAVGLSTFVTQSRSTKLAELAHRYSTSQLSTTLLAGNQPAAALDIAAGASQSNLGEPQRADNGQQLEGLLGELMGIGKMLPDTGTASMLMNLTEAHDDQNHQRLLMIRMLLGNELLADALASLCQQMGWDLVSLVYDNELDMVDLHDELARQLFARNIQLALDEQIATNSPAQSYGQLLRRLASKTQLGSRVVISLFGTGSARLLLESLAELRNQAKGNWQSAGPAEQANSLLWLTISDREPYYSLATNALGTLAVSNSVSLIPDFKSHFDGLASDERDLAQNRWWPEYMRAILVRNHRELELIANECTKWLGPQTSPLREKCRSLSLSDLAKLKQQPTTTTGGTNSSSPISATAKSSAANKTAGKQGANHGLSKYLAGGWEHNGMDVINSVLAIANGLESVRQTLCPGKLEGLCDEMRQFVWPSPQSANELPTMSELIYNELLRSTFQLADGRLFGLVQDGQTGGELAASGNGGHQLEGKLKLFNLRYLQPNSIGFVKFGTFDRQDGLIINSSKALHYSPQPAGSQATKKTQPLRALPLDQIRSTCVDSSKCLVLSQFLAGEEHFAGQQNGTGMRGAISEEELASGLNSLFKLDHPAIVSGQQQQQQHDKQTNDLSTGGGSGQSKQPKVDDLQAGEREAGETREMRWKPPISSHFHWPDATGAQTQAQAQAQEQNMRSFEVVALLPWHRRALGTNRSCSRQLNLDSPFQHLAALAFAGQSLAMMNDGGQPRNDSKQIVELTTTVIDYCGQPELAQQRLANRLLAARPTGDATSKSGRPRQVVAVIDFDESVSERLEALVAKENLLHLTVGSRSTSSARGASKEPAQDSGSHLHISLMPSKVSEIEALLAMIAAMPQWKLVHLIYTDHHHYRDEFVRRANEANICVSKLIWIPRLSSDDNGDRDESPEEYGRQLEKTRKLFRRELHDYRSSGEQNLPAAGNDGLNSTRVLVVLASGSSRNTNRLILEASSESMLEDYVWLTSHEWLRSVAREDHDSAHIADERKPRYLLSTRFETSQEGHEFGNFLAQLTPAIHRPLPTDWFDEFWQQKFTCRLPIAGAATGTGTDSSQAPAGARQLLPLCTPNQRLHVHGSGLDDRVHFVIRAMAALHSALESATTLPADGVRESLVSGFREKFESLDRHESQPYGFQIVHRLVSSPDQQGRRQNSRQLGPAEDEQLIRVGVWRGGELTLATRLASASKFDSGQELPGWLTAAAASMAADGDDLAAADARQDWNRMQQSLARLESVESRCVSAKTCQLCEQQIEQTNKLIQLEEARLMLSQSSAEPKAISSIDDYTLQRAGKPRKKSSVLDSSPGSPLEFDSANREPSNNHSSSGGDDIQAAASSLFDATVKQQIQLEQQSELRRHFADQQMAAKFRHSMGFGSASKQQPALFGVLLSLVGIICMLFTMTHLYPASYHSCRQQEHHKGQNNGYGSEMTLYGAGTADFGAFWRESANKEACKSENLVNYFLLTGLLMLYSINVAFVLPATMSVCWFRRIGLALSYTVIFSSMLAQILVHGTMQRSAARRKRKVAPAQRPVYLEEDPAGGGGDESEVEVTFESLPPITEPSPCEPQQPTRMGDQKPARACEVISNGYNRQSIARARPAADPDAPQRTGGSGLPLTISMSLILIQLVVSVLWLIEQPPEPTLYLSCWYCSSPGRSQTLFLFEPLLSLIYPAFVLLLTWFSALVYHNVAKKCETAQRRRLIASGGFGIAQPNNNYDTHEHLRYNRGADRGFSKLRDLRLTLITATLLISTWSIVTLWMISSSNAKLSIPEARVVATTASSSNSDNKQQAFDCNTSTLVYANIISGAIVFALLFLYRLNLVPCNPMSWRVGKRSNKLQGKSHAPNSASSSFRSILGNHTGASGWTANDSSTGGQHLFFTRTISEFAPHTDLAPATVSATGDQHERLGLRQFNSYGTYSHGGQFDASGKRAEASCDRGQSDKAKKRCKRSGKSSLLRAMAASASETIGGPRKYNAEAAKGTSSATKEGGSKLQRRPSAGSVASSTTKLVAREAGIKGDQFMDENDDDLSAGDDNISCASSVASSSTSQLHGNDLYPIDCSLQFDSQLPDATLSRSGFIRSSSFRRQSTRRSMNKLSSVSEEQVATVESNRT